MKNFAIYSCQCFYKHIFERFYDQKVKKQMLLFLTFLFLGATSFAQTFSGATGNIPDNSCNSNNEFQVAVSGIGTLGSSKYLSSVSLDISHTYVADLEIYLVSPGGTTTIELSTDNGGSGDNYVNTVFADDASQSITSGFAPFTGNFRPEDELSNFNGNNADGSWILKVCDDSNLDIGVLNSWSLTFEEVIYPLDFFCEDQPGNDCDDCDDYVVAENPDLTLGCQDNLNIVLLID